MFSQRKFGFLSDTLEILLHSIRGILFSSFIPSVISVKHIQLAKDWRRSRSKSLMGHHMNYSSSSIIFQHWTTFRITLYSSECIRMLISSFFCTGRTERICGFLSTAAFGVCVYHMYNRADKLFTQAQIERYILSVCFALFAYSLRLYIVLAHRCQSGRFTDVNAIAHSHQWWKL